MEIPDRNDIYKYGIFQQAMWKLPEAKPTSSQVSEKSGDFCWGGKSFRIVHGLPGLWLTNNMENHNF